MRLADLYKSVLQNEGHIKDTPDGLFLTTRLAFNQLILKKTTVFDGGELHISCQSSDSQVGDFTVFSDDSMLSCKQKGIGRYEVLEG